MPIFEYACRACGHRFETLVRGNSRPACPSCNDQKLEQQSSRQLLQRITFQYTLYGLRDVEVAAYLSHRLRVAGYERGNLFTDAAIRLLHRYSGGTPRLVNILAHKALMLAYGEGLTEIRPRLVRAAAEDTPAARRPVGLLGWLGR